MRYGEGHRKLYSHYGKELRDVMTLLEWDMVKNNKIKKDDILFYGSYNRSEQEFYRVIEVPELITKQKDVYNDGEWVKEDYKECRLVIHRITPTGKLSKNGRCTYRMYEGMRSTSWFQLDICYEVTREIFEEYVENSKNHVVSGKSRDTQKTKVYKSEWNLPPEIRSITVSDCEKEIQSFINTVVGNDEFKKINPSVTIDKIHFKLNNRRTGGVAFRRSGTIECANSQFGKSKITLLHEIAHFLAPDTYHGKEFTTNLLKLLKIEFPEAYVALKKNYDYYGVKYDG